MNKIALLSLFLYSFVYTTYCVATDAQATIKRNPDEAKNINSYNTFAPLCPTFHNTPTFNCHPIFNNYNLLYLVSISIKDSIVGLTNNVRNGVGKLASQEMRSAIKNFLWEKKFTICLYSILCSYCVVTSLLLYDYWYIQTIAVWARWKGEYSFEQLCEVTHQQLAKELMLAIQQTNINKDNPTDFIQPMTSFMATIDEEIKRIDRYVSTARMIKKMGLMTIFPTNDNKIESAQKLASRARFVKHIFLSWLAENNCINNNLVKSLQVSRAVKILMG